MLCCHVIPAGNLNVGSIAPLCCSREFSGFVTAVDVSENGGENARVLAGSGDYSVAAFQIRGGAFRLCWREREAHEGGVTAVLLGVGMSSGAGFSGGKNGAVKVWRMKTGELVGVSRALQGRVVALRQTPEGRFVVACGAEGVIVVMDASDRMKVVAKILCGEEPTAMVLEKGKIVCGFLSGAIREWSLPFVGRSQF